MKGGWRAFAFASGICVGVLVGYMLGGCDRRFNPCIPTVEHAAAWLAITWLLGNASGASLAVALRRPRAPR